MLERRARCEVSQGPNGHRQNLLRCCVPLEPILTSDFRIDFKVRYMEVMEAGHRLGERPGVLESNRECNNIALTLNPLDQVVGFRVYVDTIHARYGIDANR